MREQLGLDDSATPRPALDALAEFVLEAYSLIQRSRAYAPSGHPMQLTISDVTAYTVLQPPPIPATVFARAIFAADDVFRAAMMEDIDNG